MTAARPPILGSFEDIGEEIKQEVTKLPGDILGQALESVGLNMGGKKQGQKANTPSAVQDPNSAWQQIDQQKDEQTKKEIARAALAELTQPKHQAQEPSEYDKRIQEEEQKKQIEAEKKKQAQPVALPSSGQRKVPGIKSAVKAKTTEIGKNTRQD